MRYVLLTILVIVNYLYSSEYSRYSADGTEYRYGCPVPHILIEAVKLTENDKSYPYYIRTNDLNSLNKFHSIAKAFYYKKTKDSKVIDCLDTSNCSNIASALISTGIKNLDLGTFQINYLSYPRNLESYFMEKSAYINACYVVQEKIKNAKKWDWSVLASYHSITPELNRKYKQKLIENYFRLANNMK